MIGSYGADCIDYLEASNYARQVTLDKREL